MVLTAENVVTNQIRYNKIMSPVMKTFAWIDSMTPKTEMNFNGSKAIIKTTLQECHKYKESFGYIILY